MWSGRAYIFFLEWETVTGDGPFIFFLLSIFLMSNFLKIWNWGTDVCPNTAVVLPLYHQRLSPAPHWSFFSKSLRTAGVAGLGLFLHWPQLFICSPFSCGAQTGWHGDAFCLSVFSQLGKNFCLDKFCKFQDAWSTWNLMNHWVFVSLRFPPSWLSCLKTPFLRRQALEARLAWLCFLLEAACFFLALGWNAPMKILLSVVKLWTQSFGLPASAS